MVTQKYIPSIRQWMTRKSDETEMPLRRALACGKMLLAGRDYRDLKPFRFIVKM